MSPKAASAFSLPAKVILISTKYDVQTETTSQWAAQIPEAIAVFHRLEGENVIVDNLKRVLGELLEPALIAFYGHGHEDKLIAHKPKGTEDAPLVGLNGPCVLPLELGKHRVYAVACLAALKLGDALGAAGCEFIGYEDVFSFAPGFEHRFEKVVNDALLEWNSGVPVETVWRNLRRAWRELGKALRAGGPRVPTHMGYKALASASATLNGRSVSFHPR
jgi:hypothetical protein